MRFTHLRDVGNGCVTVAYEHDQEKGYSGQKTITAAFSFCNPNDRFDRAFGRKVATSRFMSGKTFKVELKGDSDVNISNCLKDFIISSINPIELYFKGKFDDSLLAPRWLQYDVISQFVEEMNKAKFAKANSETQSQSSCSSGCCGGGCH